MISNNLIEGKSFSWFDVEEPQKDDFLILSEQFTLPSLLVQDTLRPEHLPKYELSEEEHFFILRSFDPNSNLDSTTIQDFTRKIALFINRDRLITIHRVKLDYVEKIKIQINKKNNFNTLQELVHALMIEIIRGYERPVLNLQDMFDDFEEDILSKKLEGLNTQQIFCFRRQLFVLKRILRHTQDTLLRSKEFWEEHPSLLQDLRENIDQVYFQLDELSDNFEHLFQLHISLNDQRANDIMKVLTVFSSILLPLNFIASFYGMNFDHIPGLHSINSLRGVVLMMVLITLVSVWFFQRKGWFKRQD